MFKEGDVIQRKPEYREEPYWKRFCKGNDVSVNHEFKTVRHLEATQTVRFRSPKSGLVGVYDYKMELAVLKLENE